MVTLCLIWLNQNQLYLDAPWVKTNPTRTKPFSTNKRQASYWCVQQTIGVLVVIVIGCASPDCTLKVIKGGSVSHRTCLQAPAKRQLLEDHWPKGDPSLCGKVNLSCFRRCVEQEVVKEERASFQPVRCQACNRHSLSKDSSSQTSKSSQVTKEPVDVVACSSSEPFLSGGV